MGVLRFYQFPGLSSEKEQQKLSGLRSHLAPVTLHSLQTEYCTYVQHEGNDLSQEDVKKLTWLLSPGFHFQPEQSSTLTKTKNTFLIEVGPRLSFSSPFSTNAVSICQNIGLASINRIERSIRYLIAYELPTGQSSQTANIVQLEKNLVAALHDRMTECHYTEPLTSFHSEASPKPWSEVDILQHGRPALENVSKELGLAFDDWDLDYYTDLFKNKLKRNPTTVECFDLAQSNSEHSRHWFFKGRLIVDGKELDVSLFEMVAGTQQNSNQNNVIKFSDNSSAIKGASVELLVPGQSRKSSSFYTKLGEQHIIFTAETHNFPTGVAPFSGATTGTGGRIRDVQAAGQGAHVVAGTAAYCFGNLNIPGYRLPWEDQSFKYPGNFAPPLQIAVEASNGASDYGNKFGEPVLAGFARSFGMLLPNGERREWIKPIMFSGGIGRVDAHMVLKDKPEKGMLVVKVGGPVYRIGVGGGSASSVHVQGDQEEELDFGAVQRGDAEMEQKLNRVIRACLEDGEGNLICSIHDQGAGGNGNVLKELVEPEGAVIMTEEFQLGDPTINTLELWGAEYQESNAILVRASRKGDLEDIAQREKCPVSFVGVVTGDGKIVLKEKENGTQGRHPVDLELEYVLGSMPRKVFELEPYKPDLHPLSLPTGLSVREALERVLRLPAVASKRYLTNKVDRCVTGLVAQQQCVGPLHTPLADAAVVSMSYFDKLGGATSIGEQPIKGLINPAAGARMAVAEAITNLLFVPITSLQDVKCSGNWMWAAKLPGEGAALVSACQAMCQAMAQLGIAIDGGKDSLSMAARVGNETVKAPGAIVISAYAQCTDITKLVTPDLKCPEGKGCLLHVDLSEKNCRLGGTALAQCYSQLGDVAPDLEKPLLLREAFAVTQALLLDGKISAGHDISDGGLIVCLLEMSFAGNCGLEVQVNERTGSCSPIEILFAEEVGWVLEVSQKHVIQVTEAYKSKGIPCQLVGHSVGQASQAQVLVSVGVQEVLREPMHSLRDVWEETSFQLERFQCSPACVNQEQDGLKDRRCPPYKCTFDITPLDRLAFLNGQTNQESRVFVPPAPSAGLNLSGPSVAVIREEGSNGDREMAAALFMAGFQVHDVVMTDLLTSAVSLDAFRGIIFPGGFSYADVLGSARGWAASFLFDDKLRKQLSHFQARPDTFSLGVCNGCQLLALLGWVAPADDGSTAGVQLCHNSSERFECRFATVTIRPSPALMLKGMEGSTLGIWVAHGEGRFSFDTQARQKSVEENHLAPLRYVNDDGHPTEVYPLNPNGSPGGIAALCSADGRHLAMMPHPERCVLTWQWPWAPPAFFDGKSGASPWIQMFTNAYLWCCQKS